MNIIYDIYIYHTTLQNRTSFRIRKYDNENLTKVLKRDNNSKGPSSKTIKDVLVHRKGATSIFPAGMEQIPYKYRDIVQPVIISSSIGTASWLLLEGYNSKYFTFGSAAHGAGRMMYCQSSKRGYAYDNVCEEIKTKGVYFISLVKPGIVEEIPAAYKDMDLVADISHELGIGTKVPN